MDMYFFVSKRDPWEIKVTQAPPLTYACLFLGTFDPRKGGHVKFQTYLIIAFAIRVSLANDRDWFSICIYALLHE